MIQDYLSEVPANPYNQIPRTPGNTAKYSAGLIETLVKNLLGGLSSQYLYNQGTKRVFPSSPYYAVKDANINDPKEVQKLTLDTIMGMIGGVKAVPGASKITPKLSVEPVGGQKILYRGEGPENVGGTHYTSDLKNAEYYAEVNKGKVSAVKLKPESKTLDVSQKYELNYNGGREDLGNDFKQKVIYKAKKDGFDAVYFGGVNDETIIINKNSVTPISPSPLRGKPVAQGGVSKVKNIEEMLQGIISSIRSK